jgi:serine/threonine-protein phosphatase 2B regulatory subunit
MAAVQSGNAALPVFEAPIPGNAFQEAQPPGEYMPRQYTDDQIKEAFDTFDLDQNKFIGVAEIRHILAIIGEQASDAEMDEMIRMCDTDGDGQVTYDEFYKLFYNPVAPPRSQHPADAVADIPMQLPSAMGSMPKAPPPAPLPGGPVAPQGLQQVENVGPQRIAGNVAAGSVMGTESMDAVMKTFTAGKKLKPVYIKKLYKKFKQVDKDNSGTIDYSEFLQVMEEEDHPLMVRMFRLFDADNSGRLELKEFIVGLSNYTSAAKTDKLKFAFMMFDEDGSGFIERGELVRILKSTFRMDPSTVDNSEKALQAQADLEARATAILTDLGLPANGSMSYDKFMELAKTQPNLLYPAMRIEKTVPSAFSIDNKLQAKTNADRAGLLQDVEGA